MKKGKINVFRQQFIAMSKEENIEVIAENAWKSADAAFISTIASLKGDTVEFELSIDDAKVGLESARINHGRSMSTKSDRANYISNLIDAENLLNQRKFELESHDESIKFLEKEHALLKTKVEEEVEELTDVAG